MSARLVPCAPRPGRHAALAVVLLVLAPAFLACADVERTVVDKGVGPAEGRGETRVVAWESDRYPRHVAEVVANECWDEAAIGGPLPDVCLRADTLASETDPYRAFPWVANIATFVAIGGLLLLAWRMVGWQPPVARATGEDPVPHHFDEDSAVSLMQSTERERSARIDAESHRRDPSHPFLTGVLLTLLALMLLALLIGYGRAFGWALTTGVTLFIGVGPVTAVLQLNFWRPDNIDAAIARASFLCGAAGALALGGFVALLFRTPLLNLHGIDWPT